MAWEEASPFRLKETEKAAGDRRRYAQNFREFAPPMLAFQGETRRSRWMAGVPILDPAAGNVGHAPPHDWHFMFP
jgi:hypothetical protein